MRIERRVAALGVLSAFAILLLATSLVSCGLKLPGVDTGRLLPKPGPRPDDKPQMKKFVTQDASFVLYMPSEWTAEESEQSGYRTVKVTDPKGDYEVTMNVGRDFTGGDPVALAKEFLKAAQERYGEVQVTEAEVSKTGDRIAFDGTYSDPDAGSREFRAWGSTKEGEFVISTITAPEGKLDSSKELLLTILSNIEVMKGAIQYSGPPPVQVNLVPFELSDGSATFKMPEGWRVEDFGSTYFIAHDGEGTSFSSGSVDVITPALGLQNSPIPVSEYLVPKDALKFLGEQAGTITNVEYTEVNDHDDLEAQMESAFPAGGVEVQDMTYACTSREGVASKGYTIGFSFYSSMGTNWTFKHLTVLAPEDDFDAYAATFAEMIQSFTIDQEWVAGYVAQGQQRLRQMQQETSDLVARNSDDIREMTSAAYEERQASQDYIDYQRSSYIRGEQDWVSEAEGGTVYHSDSWGTQNTATGDYYEGQPYNYFNYTGENPNYNEQMTPIDSRELWEQNVK